MTEEQYKKYENIKKEIEQLKGFLFWCGKKYHGGIVGNYPIRIIKKRFCIGRKSYGAIKSDVLEIPETLQDRIVEIIENYVDEKQKELDEI